MSGHWEGPDQTFTREEYRRRLAAEQAAPKIPSPAQLQAIPPPAPKLCKRGHDNWRIRHRHGVAGPFCVTCDLAQQHARRNGNTRLEGA